MKCYQLATLAVVALLLLASITQIDAKRKKHKNYNAEDASRKTKTKTKWSTTTDLGAAATSSMVATEEHGYYVKRTFVPANATHNNLRSPPFLAIPIAWFQTDADKTKEAGALNSNANALSEGFLCDDDCVEPYAPICGKTHNEIAVFYNKCKLNVAKCRTHGLWLDLAYDECQKLYPKETAYTDKKFRCNPFFRDSNTTTTTEAVDETKEKTVLQQQADEMELKATSEAVPVAEEMNEMHVQAAVAALDEISEKLAQVEALEEKQQQKQQQPQQQQTKIVANVKNIDDRLKYAVA